MLLLFSLCEYNLKIIFAHQNSQEKDRTIKVDKLAQASKQEDSNSIESLIKRHMQPDSPGLDRFRTLLTFFITNKKLINTFIRSNNQVINAELK